MTRLVIGIVCFSSIAIGSTYTWDADGNINGRVSGAINISGIFTNWWIDLAEHPRIGQTFKCPGDRLEEVGFGLWRFKSGLGVNKQVSRVVFTLRKNGPDGPIAKKRIFPKGKVPQKERRG